MVLPFSVNNANKTGFASLLTLAGLIRLSVPHSKYIFFPLLIAGFLIALFDLFRNKQALHALKLFLTAFSIVILNILIHLIGILRTPDSNVFIVKEFLNAFTVIPFAFTLYQLIGTLPSFYEYIRKTLNLVIYVGLFLIIAGFLKFCFEMTGSYWSILNPADYPIGTSLTNDRNFYTLVPIFALVVIASKLTSKSSIQKSILFQVQAFIITVGTVMTTSRRAIIILMVLHGMLAFYLLMISLKTNRTEGTSTLKNTFLYWFLFFFTGASLFLVSRNVELKDIQNFMNRNKANTSAFQAYFTTLTYQVKSMIVKDININDVHINLWYNEIDRLFPFSENGNQTYSRVASPEQSPVDDTIMSLDKYSQFRVLNNTAYSFTRIGNSPVISSNCYQVLVWCLVSDDFNGDAVILNPGKNQLKNHSAEYDLNKRGTWQPLSLVIKSDSIYSVPIYFAFSQYNQSDFSTLSGQLLVTDPIFNHINEQKAVAMLPLKSGLNHPFIYIPTFEMDHLLSSSDNILQSSLAIPRIQRWRYGWELLTTEYSTWHKVTGNGFDYMKKYALNFFNNDQRLDWPHNPLLSLVLYSGILGLLVYLVLILQVLYLFLKHNRTLWIFFIWYLIALFYSLFSGNNPFDPPLLGYILTIPLLYHNFLSHQVKTIGLNRK